MNKTVSVVITAAGNGARMGVHKILMLIKGKPLIWYTLRQFKQAKHIDEIVIASKKEDIMSFERILQEMNMKAKIVLGGSERIVSEYNGIMSSRGDFIITHDGCRPFPPVLLINTLVESVIKYGAAMTAVNPTATVKYSKGKYIQSSFPRKHTWIAQTPQGFKRKIILKALKKAIKNKYHVATDDSELVSTLGVKIRIVPGDDMNIKVTYPKDIYIAEKILEVGKI